MPEQLAAQEQEQELVKAAVQASAHVHGPVVDADLPHCLQGGGECGSRLRAIDWSRRPLGPPQKWPVSLQSTIRLMLHSRYAMWMLWGPAKTFFCNDAYLPTVGLRREWVLGAPADCVWQEIWNDIGPRIDHVLQGGSATWDEALPLFLQRNGYVEETYHTFSYSAVHDESGAVQGMLCVVTEVTDRVITERRLAYLGKLGAVLTSVTSAEQVAHALEATLPDVAHDLPYVALYGFDSAKNCAQRLAATAECAPYRSAPAALQLDDPQLGYASLLRGEAQPALQLRPVQSLALPPGPWRDSPRQAVMLPLARSGQELPRGLLLLALNPYRPIDEAFRQFLQLIAVQVAAALARAAAQQEEHQRAEALAELNRSKTEFFTNVSHELRTPLTLILGPLEQVLREPSSLTDLQQQELQTVHRNSLRLLKLVNSLLEFSRIEAGRAVAQREAIDLARLTADIANGFRSTIERAGLALQIDCPSQGEHTVVDAQWWEKIVLNLLSNALKHTFQGHIRVITLCSEAQFECRIEDSGIGITQAELPRIFERFYRVPGARARTHEGSGIGLSLVADLIRLQGGSVQVESAPDRGSCFTLRLPRSAAVTAAAATQPKPESDGAQQTPWRVGFVSEAERWLDTSVADAPPVSGSGDDLRPQLLLAEDNADMREYVTRLLAGEYRVVAVADGLQALAALTQRSARPELLLTDVMMPKMDGLALMRAIRGNPRLRDLPIIVLSARSGEAARLSGLAEGADDYLVKPFSANELRARVRTHLQLARSRAATRRELEEAVGHATTALEIGELGTWSWLIDTDAVTADARCRQILGVERDTPLSYAGILRRVYGEDVTAVRTEIERVLQPGASREFAHELRVIGGDGSLRWIRVRGRLLDGDDAEAPQRMIGTIRDVTERKRVHDALCEADHRKDMFLATLAHELRNPLAPLRSAARAMQDPALPPERQRWCGDVIARQVQHMSGLLDDLLDVSRVSLRRLTLKKQSVPLGRLVDAAVEAARPLIDLHHHTLIVELPQPAALVAVDPLRVTQILTNLLTNAAKYTCPGGQIVLSAQMIDLHLELRVRDNGIGLAAHETAVVFEMFAQIESARERSQGGLGIGLALVKGLVLLHGGTVQAHSKGVGLGCEFVIQLPQPAQIAQIALPAGDSASAAIHGVATRPRRILIADDNRDAADANAMLLRMSGCEVQTAYDGKAALAACQQWLPDVAVLDIGMPGMDGYAVARALRNDAATANIRLIAVTGWGREENKRAANEAGFTMHMTKPVDPEALSRAILA